MHRSALPLVLGVWGLVRIGLRSIALEAFRHSLERWEDPLSERTPGGTTHLGGHCKKLSLGCAERYDSVPARD